MTGLESSDQDACLYKHASDAIWIHSFATALGLEPNTMRRRPTTLMQVFSKRSGEPAKIRNTVESEE